MLADGPYYRLERAPLGFILGVVVYNSAHYMPHHRTSRYFFHFPLYSQTEVSKNVNFLHCKDGYYYHN